MNLTTLFDLAMDNARDQRAANTMMLIAGRPVIEQWTAAGELIDMDTLPDMLIVAAVLLSDGSETHLDEAISAYRARTQERQLTDAEKEQFISSLGAKACFEGLKLKLGNKNASFWEAMSWEALYGMLPN